ncbi:hypothetical protein AALP_AA2G017700 [Arabis alpina]|uniref:Peptidase S8/S53 domain-containing protein n=1 Tax=Arabis alpina TaxID=50452 RepID=A0A087HEQ5_ARAAL|nr:hypothetical protein AALP_AA2G017700 [Arabis alpina]
MILQATKLKEAKGVKAVEEDKGVRLMTTYTPDFLELPQQVWPKISKEGNRRAGEDIVIGFVDTGINPTHPSFAALDLTNPFSSNLSRLNFSGDCEIGPLFPPGSCNGKIISARFFSAGARASVDLNASLDILSPFDASGHGSHVASIAAGNAGVPVTVDGFYYGRASGMAPRARIAVYKAIYPSIGTLVDVIAAIDQAIMDGVDVLTLSVGLDEPPVDKPTVLGIFDLAMLLARKAGVFVVQAAGNHGPSPSSVVSYSPWVVGVAAGSTDRSYPASLILDGGTTVQGVGLSDILAPGHQIWGAWSFPSAYDPILTGRNFAILSGTSMAAPHIAGIGALIKQLNPSWTPAMIASAISTTASGYDRSGEVVSAESYGIGEWLPSNHFAYGAGHVNPARAIDPGLVLPAGFEDYISFLCSLPNINPATIRAATGVWCTTVLSHPANLNQPSVTISALSGSLVLPDVEVVDEVPEVEVVDEVPEEAEEEEDDAALDAVVLVAVGGG